MLHNITYYASYNILHKHKTNDDTGFGITGIMNIIHTNQFTYNILLTFYSKIKFDNISSCIHVQYHELTINNNFS